LARKASGFAVVENIERSNFFNFTQIKKLHYLTMTEQRGEYSSAFMLSRKYWGSILTATAVFAISFFSSALMYSRFQSVPFAEDDVRFILNAQGLGDADKLTGLFESDNPLTDVLGSLLANRIRIFSDLVLYFVYLLAGESSSTWFAYRLLFLSVSSVLVYLAAQKSFRFGLPGLFASTVYISSRFLLYDVTQIFGIMELTSIILLLLVFIMVRKHSETRQESYLYLAALAFFFLYYSHERFQLVAIACLVYTFLAIRDPWSKAKWGLLFALPIVLGAATRVVLQMPQFVGTGSVNSLGFDFSTAVNHSFNGILQILGFNLGPEYLVGVPFDLSPEWIQIFALVSVSAAIIAFTGFLASLRQINLSREKYIFGFFQFVLFLVVFLSGMVTIRLEQRWLVAPFIIVVITMAQIMHRSPLPLKFFAGLFLSINVLLSTFYIPNSNQLFFNQWQSRADAYLSQVEQAWEYSAQKDSPIVLIVSDQSATLPRYLDDLLTANSLYDGEFSVVGSIEEASFIPGIEDLFVIVEQQPNLELVIVEYPNDFLDSSGN
jgi:hypothetical protein